MIVGGILKSLDLNAMSQLGTTLWEMDYILMIPKEIYKFCACDKKALVARVFTKSTLITYQNPND